MAEALLDTNVLVHAASQRSPLHREAAELLQRALQVRGLYCLAPQNLIEFASVITRPKFVEKPLSPKEVRRMGMVLYKSRSLRKIYPRRATVARALGEGQALGVTGRPWYDLFLAVTMRDAGIRDVVTENLSDFQKFPFVRARTIKDALSSNSG